MGEHLRGHGQSWNWTELVWRCEDLVPRTEEWTWRVGLAEAARFSPDPISLSFWENRLHFPASLALKVVSCDFVLAKRFE